MKIILVAYCIGRYLMLDYMYRGKQALERLEKNNQGGLQGAKLNGRITEVRDNGKQPNIGLPGLFTKQFRNKMRLGFDSLAFRLRCLELNDRMSTSGGTYENVSF